MIEEKETPNGTKQQSAEQGKSRQGGGISIVDGMRVVVGLLLLNGLVSFLVTGSWLWNYNPWWARPKAIAAMLRTQVVLTDDELSKYAGQTESLPIYVALNGTIYDVTAGRRIYSPGGPYHHFAGRDATRGYITGCFKEDSVSDIRGVEWTYVPVDVPRFAETLDQDLSEAERNYRYEMVEAAFKEVDKAIEHWSKVFRGETGRDYFQVGHIRRKDNMMKVPMRPLCASAEKKRPKSKFDPNKTYVHGGQRAMKARRQELEHAKRAKPPRKEGHDEI